MNSVQDLTNVLRTLELKAASLKTDISLCVCCIQYERCEDFCCSQDGTVSKGAGSCRKLFIRTTGLVLW